MMESSNEEAKTLQRDVQQLLGRCMLRLQQYERQMKTIVAHCELSGPAHDLEAIRAGREDRSARKTLGALVGEFTGSILVGDEGDTEREAAVEGPEGVDTLSVRTRMILPEDDFAKIEIELKGLVRLRNDLVHHFIDHHDLWSVDGCRKAQAALIAGYEQIDQCYDRLCDWAGDMSRAQQVLAEHVGSAAFRNLVIHGIQPDGRVDWPASSLVSGFREAARALAKAKGGWISVPIAGHWVVEKYPDQSPERFGCKTWQQALQESNLFELRHVRQDGRSETWFRERPNARIKD